MSLDPSSIQIQLGLAATLETIELPKFGKLQTLYTPGSAQHREDRISMRVVGDTLHQVVLDGFSNVRYPPSVDRDGKDLILIGNQSCGQALVARAIDAFESIPTSQIIGLTPAQIADYLNKEAASFMREHKLSDMPPSQKPGAAGLVLRLSKDHCETCHWQDPVFVAWGLREKVALPNHHYEEEMARVAAYQAALREASKVEGFADMDSNARRSLGWAIYGPNLARFRDEFQNNLERPHSAILDGSPNFSRLTQVTKFSSEEVRGWRGIISGTDGGVSLHETATPDLLTEALLGRVMLSGPPDLKVALDEKNRLDAEQSGISHVASAEWCASMLLFNEDWLEQR